MQENAMQEDEPEVDDGPSEKRKQPDGSEEPEVVQPKKARTEGPSDFAVEQQEDSELEAPEDAPEDEAEKPKTTLYNEPEISWSSMVLTKPSPEMRGHTSYLTFATFYPASIRAQMSAQEGNTTALPTRAGSPTADAE